MMRAAESSFELDLDASLAPRASDCPIPLAGPQRRWWRHLEMHRQQNVGAIASAVRITGALNVELLRRSVDAVVARHESLRTRIAAADCGLRQHVDPPGNCRLEAIDLSSVAPASTAPEARRLAEEFVEQPLDLFNGPLFKVALLTLSAHDHVLLLAAEHMIADAASFTILHKDIWALYRHGIPEACSALQPLPVQFADYAVWQDRTHEAWRRRHERHWREHLAGVPRTLIPVDNASAETGAPALGTLYVPFGKRLSDGLRQLAGRERLQLPLVVLAAYVCAMSRWCNQRDLLVALISHGRHCHPQLKGMVGFLAACLLLRIEVAGRDTFLDLLRRIELEFAAAFAHYDFDRVLELIPECTTQLGFNWVAPHALAGRSDQRLVPPDGVRIQAFPLRLSWVDNLLTFFSDSAAGIVASITYRPGFIARESVERFASDLRALSSEMVEHPAGCIDTVSGGAAQGAGARLSMRP